MSETAEEKVERIRRLQKRPEEAKAMRCVCTGFTLQYEGSCQCVRGRAVSVAEGNIRLALETI